MYFNHLRIIWKLLPVFIWYPYHGRFALLNTSAFLRELWRDSKWFKTLVMHFPSHNQLRSLIFTGFVRASIVALQTNRPNFFPFVSIEHWLLTPACILADKSGIPSWILHAKGRPREIGLFTGAMSFRHIHKSNLFLPDRLINLYCFV